MTFQHAGVLEVAGELVHGGGGPQRPALRAQEAVESPTACSTGDCDWDLGACRSGLARLKPVGPIRYPIRYIEIKNFKLFGAEPQRIDLDHPTVLIGPNNCGKTTVIRMLSRHGMRARDALHPGSALLRRSTGSVS